MRGIHFQVLAFALIAFVAASAQCVASCGVESALAAAHPPCHKTPEKSCPHDQAARDSGKLLKLERPLVAAAVPSSIEPLPDELLAAPARPPEPRPPSRDSLTSTVLRI